MDQHHIPANAPALAYWDDSAPGYSMAFEGVATQGAMKWNGGPALNDGSSAPQKFEIREDTRLLGARLLVATPVWESGWRYAIPLEARCGDVKYPEGHTIFTEPTHALPSSIGTASAVANTKNGTLVTIQMSPELAAFIDVTMFEVVIDGSVWAQIPYGQALRDAAGNVALHVFKDGVFLGRPRTGAPLCLPADPELTTRPIEIRAHVAGADDAIDPKPILVSTPFRCKEASNTTPAPPSDPGTPPSGGGSGSGIGQPSSGEGCMLASSSHSSAPPWAAGALVVVAHVIMRARRRLRSSDR